MPIDSSELLIELGIRLPELEWKINELGSFFPYHSLPKGLFRAAIGSRASLYIAEIKADIDGLMSQESERGSFYLAERIRRKVNVLVALCQIHRRKNKLEQKKPFELNMLSTRQQWIANLETNISTLEVQKQAMNTALEQMLRSSNSAAILELKAELGELDRRLTLAQETLNRAIFV